MKKLVLLYIVLLFMTLNAKSQISKNTITIGGEIYGNVGFFDSDQGNSSSEYNIGFGPQIGYFLINNLEIGLRPGFSYNYNKYSFDNDWELKNSSWETSINIFCNKYFGEGPLKPYVGIGFQFGYLKVKSIHSSIDESSNEYDYENEFKSFNLITDATAGIAYFINQSISIDILLNYGYSLKKWNRDTDSSNKFDENDKRHEIYFGTGINVFIPMKN